MSDEPILNLKNIQGNVVAGFKKPFQTLLYYRIIDDDGARFKQVIPALAERVATADQVLAHNRIVRRARAGGSPQPMATWMNLAFSSAGLGKLTSDVDQFADNAFLAGMVEQSHLLGDPPGSSDGWTVNDRDAHLLIIVAADDETARDAEVANIRNLIQQNGGATEIGSGDEGFVLKDPIFDKVREHFGYRDGVSQPGVRGRATATPGDWITPRETANPNHGKPGQELVWPGEFVFGYPDEDGQFETSGTVDWMISGDGFPLAPNWAKDGSYLVFRRLRQHVHLFHEALDSDLDGAQTVGRWPSGTPLLIAPTADQDYLADHETFVFTPGDVEDCPGTAHIRKINPRGEIDGGDGRKHRLLRRGITFGAGSASTLAAPVSDGVERGLLFLAHMTSIRYQFEFVMKSWANNSDFRTVGIGADELLSKAWIEPTGGGYYFAPSLSALNEVLSA